MFEKVKKGLYNSILILLIIMVLYVIYRAVFDIYQPYEKLKPSVIMLGTIILIMVLVAIKKIIDKLSEKQMKIIAIILTILFFIGLSIFGNTLTSIPNSDLKWVINESNNMLKTGDLFNNDGYISKYSHQSTITIIIYWISKLGSSLNLEYRNINDLAIIFSAFCIAVSAFFTYLSIKKVFDEKKALLVLIFFILNPIMYIYSSYYYTDIMCMPFASIGIYLYICSLKNENKKIRILELLLAGLVIAIGCKIRVVVAIILIAILLVSLLQKKEKKQMLKRIALIGVGFLIGIIIIKLITLQFGEITDKKNKMPMTQYLVYGLNKNSDGKWDEEDHDNTLSYEIYSDRISSNINTIKERIKDLGIIGIIELEKEKLAVMWSNGDYDYISKFVNVEEVNGLYSYFAGDRKIFMLYILQIFKVTLMTLLLIATIYELKNKKEDKYDYILISIFGAFLFYMFWEASPRYSLSFFPWIVLTIPVGIKCIQNFLNIDTINFINSGNKISTINLKKILKYIFGATICATIILGIADFRECCIEKNTYYDMITMQQRDDTQYKIAQNTIMQTFTANKKFNSISIRFYKTSSKDITHYNFVLLNQNKEELVNQKFTSDDIVNSKFKLFSFKTVKPNKNEKYTIKIYSEDATKENSISICFSGEKNYDSYLGGDFYINDEEQSPNMLFIVQKENYRTLIPKWLYIVGIFVIIAIEVYIFSPWIRKEISTVKEQ